MVALHVSKMASFHLNTVGGSYRNMDSLAIRDRRSNHLILRLI